MQLQILDHFLFETLHCHIFNKKLLIEIIWTTTQVEICKERENSQAIAAILPITDNLP